jgi:P4 family phage/plasmid primase-like protien
MDLTTALSAEHYQEITHDSAVAADVAAARGYRTLTGTGADRDELNDLGFKPFVWSRDDAYPGLLIPMHGADGTVRGHQFKPAVPRKRVKTDQSTTPIKYESPSKAPLVIDVPEYTRGVLTDTSVPLWLTEGMKKTDALVSQGLAAIGLTGVFNWRNSHGVLGDWEEIPIKGRVIVLCFDADAAGNRNVQLAMSRLGAWLRTKGASTVHYLVVPPKVGESDVKGVDDYFAAGGDLETLRSAATQTAPGAGEKDAAFTDAFLVEELAEALDGQYCWASGLGWLRWTGRVWKEVSDVEPLEAVRVWASEQFDRILTQQRQEPARNLGGQIMGWRAVLGKSRLTALRDLARGLLQKDSAEFDGDPDLFTVENGTLHLPSGRLLPFDPSHCITKAADAEYRRGFTHPLWTKALRAIPGDMHEWYQDRLGQALTGYPVPDHTLVIGHGSGSNGKSTIVSTVRRTMGDYGVMISDRVLMASPDAHPTELMDLRGARYAVMEETPEARHLNVQRLKTVLGTESIKARRIRQDPVEFLTSHSLFINTNYRPVVTETDWGTWRRLSLMPFPFTFKKPGKPLESPWDREGDPALAYAANDPEVRSAALAWMAEGAREWYARGRMMLPAPDRVEKETREWRAETDLILGFTDECLRFDREAFTQTRDMLTAFNSWVEERGHRPWNDRTFATRFGDHDTVRGAKVKQGRFSVKGKQLRGWSGVEINRDGEDPFTGERDVPQSPAGGYDAGEGNMTWIEDGVPGPMDYSDFPEQTPESLCEQPQSDHFIGANKVIKAPVTLAFDLETADAKHMFTGQYEGPFVRLAGAADTTDEEIGAANPMFVAALNAADVIYGANILGFDLLALAHHHGADYDALAAKAVDLTARERLVDPPMSKKKTSYKLDAIAERYGVAGKTDDIKALANRYGGFDKIPVDSREYQDYLRGDLAATKAVKAAQDARVAELGLEEYAAREMRVVAIQNRVTLNGWKVDTELLAERVAHEDEQRSAAVKVLNEEFGVPLAKPDRFKLRKKSDMPEAYRTWPIEDLRGAMAEDPAMAELEGLAERIPGEVSKKPWTTNEGRDAIVKAFADAGAPQVPRSPTGTLRTSSDALGEEEWYDKDRRKNVKGMLQVYGHIPEVRRIVDHLMLATGARDKYAEIVKWLSPQGRAHSKVGAAQGSGRWAYTEFSVTNMGMRGAAGEERAVMVADEGQVLLTCDASQVDMRAVAALSQDPAYMALFEPGRDAHMEMAEVYFGERTPEKRQRTKRINHKFNYGGGVESTSVMEKIPREIVQQAFDAREAAYPVLREWLAGIRNLAASGALLDNGFGRLMRPDPERAATQGPALMGQGAARDIVCESLLRLVDRDKRVLGHLRGFVHDEAILSVPEDEAGYWAEVLADAFTWTWRDVPILCEVGKPAFRWSECK